MKRFVYARYVGETDDHYKQGHNYLLHVRPAYFRKRVSIANIHGYHNAVYGSSKRTYPHLFDFEQNWKVIEEHDRV